MSEYEYEYYSVSQNWPITITNDNRLPKNVRMRIRTLFGFPEMTKNKYEDKLQLRQTRYFWQRWVLKEEHSPTHFLGGLVDKAPRLSIRIVIWILSSDTFCQLNQSHTKSEAAMLSKDGLFQSSEKWKCCEKFSCAYLPNIGAHSSKVSMIRKMFIVFRKIPSRIRFKKITRIWIQIIFGLKNNQNTNTNGIRLEKIAWIWMPIIFGFKKSPKYAYEY